MRSDYKRPVLPGLAIAALTLTLMGALASQLSAWSVSALLALVAFGIGPCTATVNAVAQNAAPARQLGALTGAMALSRTLGTAVVVAAGSAMIVAHVRLGGGALAGGLLAGGESAAAQTLPETTRAAARRLRELFFFAAAIALALLCYAWIRPRTARGRTGRARARRVSWRRPAPTGALRVGAKVAPARAIG
ncbi:MFS transporter [Lysobacter enzymogenes]|nr:MFS transporter [Lysobacter enzymogenes]QCW26916.1 MFS transporter [Lysobacter enzymogenes]